jgi:hypothetical protein
MGSATSSISAEPIVAAAAVVGALGYGYVHYVHPTQSDGTDADGDVTTGAAASKAAASALHGQKKRGRKLQLPGDATLKNLDILDAPGSVPLRSVSASTREPTPISATRQRRQQHRSADQSQVAIPGGLDGAVASSDDVRDTQQQPPKKEKRKKGKKVAVSDLSSASASTSAAAASQLASGSAEGTAWSEITPATIAKAKKGFMPASVVATDALDERWTRVEARRKKAAPLQATGTDATTSDAGITTSVTDNSSPVAERTTEDELPPELDECVLFSVSRVHI